MRVPFFSNQEAHEQESITVEQHGHYQPFALNPIAGSWLLINIVSNYILGFSENAAARKIKAIKADGDAAVTINNADHDSFNFISSATGETVEAERQRLIKNIHPVFNEAIEEPTIAVQPFFYGVRLDGNDPAKNAESLITEADFRDASFYGAQASRIFGRHSATAIGSVAAVMCFLGFLHATSAINSVEIVDTFATSAATAGSSIGGLLSILGAAALSSIAFIASLPLAHIFAKKSEPHYRFAFISRYAAKIAESLAFEVPTKDSRVSFPKKRHELNRYLKTLQKRIGESRRYKNMKLPTIRLGTSTGEFRDAGLQDGLESGTPLEVAVNDLYMNFAILGGTGSGKTSSILAPVIRQLFIHRRNGTIGLFGMYVSDAKGVFWVDIKQIAIEEGLPPEDVIVIGTEAGQYGVHLTKGLPPELLSAFISSIMATVEGSSKSGGGAAFYEGMFNLVSTYAAVLLDAYDRSPAGSRFTAVEHRSIYCIERLYEMLTSEIALEKMIKELLTEVEAAGTNAKFFSKAATDAVEYFNGPWQGIEKDTKANLVATVQKSLGGLMSNPGIKVRFFEGRDNILLRDEKTGEILRDEKGNPQYLEQFDIEGNPLRYTDVDAAFKGKLVCSSISAEKGGVGASFTISALSNRAKMISTSREIEFKSYNDSLSSMKAGLKAASASIKRAVGLVDASFDDNDLFADLAVNEHFEQGPVITTEMVNSLANAPSNEDYEQLEASAKPLNPQQVPTFLVFDEFQEFAVKGGKNFPLGDDFYWAKNRSKGVIGIVAFQFRASIEQFMGKDATTTMLGNMRNKVILHSEDVEFIQYMSQLCGKVRRHHVPTGYGYSESPAQKELTIVQDMAAAGILNKAGSYPDMKDVKDIFLGVVSAEEIRISDEIIIDEFKSKETLSYKRFEAASHAIKDDADFSYSERLRSSKAQMDSKKMSALTSNSPLEIAPSFNAAVVTRDPISAKLNDTYHSLEREAMDQSSDYDEDLVSIERVVNSRNCAIAYVQSYSGVIKDYYYVKQDHELKAERSEIHKLIANQKKFEGSSI